jgi:hypothetical protein
MSYRIAGIDVHKKMLAVVVADVEVEGEYQFERHLFGSNPDHLRLLANWLIEQQVEEVVMESTARPAKNEKVPARCQERSIWRRHNRIAGHAGARRISLMPNAW